MLTDERLDLDPDRGTALLDDMSRCESQLALAVREPMATQARAGHAGCSELSDESRSRCATCGLT